MKSRTITGVLVCLLSVTFAEAAGDEELDLLREQVRILTARLDRLEQSQAQTTPVTPPSPVAPASDWSDRIRVKGDLRYRYEGISEEGSENRNRNRIRARLDIGAKVNDTVDVGFRLATGVINPTSSNQSLDTAFSRKGFGLDLAYFRWKASDYLGVVGGKIKNPLYRPHKSELIWDSDLNPEGLAVQYNDGNFFGAAFAYYTEERSSDTDSYLVGVQGGYKTEFNNGMNLTFGAGYFDHQNVQGNQPLLDGNPRGNVVDGNGNLVSDFNELEVFAEWGTQVGNLPLSLMLDWVKNLEADRADTGYLFGARLGKLSSPGTWEVAAYYEDIEADATLSTFNWSDFAAGETDASGIVLKAGYAISNNLSAAASYFLNKRRADTGNEQDIDGLQLDMQFKF